jgi:HAD superfamily hydrolase (TIGR01549 family)
MAETTKAVIFDWDDTLVSTFGPKVHQWIDDGLKHYKTTITADEVRAQWGKPLPVIAMELFGIKEEDSHEILRIMAEESHNYPKVPFEGSLSLVKLLKSAGYILCLVTSTSAASMRRDMDYDPDMDSMLRCFGNIFAADDVEHHKPDPRVFDDVLAELGLEPEQAIYIGDGEHDASAALMAGLGFIGVNSGPTPIDPNFVSENGRRPLAIVDNISEVAGLLNLT